jgi:hypothetical protein
MVWKNYTTDESILDLSRGSAGRTRHPLFLTEDREESLPIHYQRKKQSLLGSFVRADTNLFASVATFVLRWIGIRDD